MKRGIIHSLAVMIVALAARADLKVIQSIRERDGRPSMTIDQDAISGKVPIYSCTNLSRADWVLRTVLIPENLTWVDTNVTAHTKSMFYHAGQLPPIQISGQVWEDRDGNGVRDAGEPSLDGISVRLWLVNPEFLSLDTTTTADGGVYQFSDLKMNTYVVAFTPPTGFRHTRMRVATATAATDSDPDPTTNQTPEILMKLGQRTTTIDAGLLVPGSLHSRVFEDLNGNGRIDAEPGLAGVEITLTGDVNGDGQTQHVSTISDTNGNYAFLNLYPGDYQVTATPTAGSAPTTPMSFTISIANREAIVSQSGEAGFTDPDEPRHEMEAGDQILFGLTYPGSIHGHAYIRITTGAPPGSSTTSRLPDVTITLSGDVDGDEVLDFVQDVTDNHGAYDFTNLYPGTYTVRTQHESEALELITASEFNVSITSRKALVTEDGGAELSLDDPRHEYNVAPSLIFGYSLYLP